MAVHRRRAPSACSPSPPCAGCTPAGVIVAAAKYPDQRELARELGRRPRWSSRASCAGRCGAPPAPWRSATATSSAHRRRRRGGRLRRQRGQPGRRPGRGPARGPGRHGRACPATSHVDLTGLWHREITLAGRLRLRHRALGRRRRPAHLRPGLRAGRPPPTSAASSAPPTPWPTTPTPSPTPPAPAAAARVKIAFDLRQRRNAPMTSVDAPPRIRPRGRPLDPADAVPPRRELPPREAARRAQPRHLPARAARAASTTSTGAIRHALLNPEGDSDPLPDLLLAGHEADHRLRRHLAAAAPDAPARHPPAGHRGRARPGRRGRRRRRRTSSPPSPCTGA